MIIWSERSSLKNHTLYGSISITYGKKQNYRNIKQVSSYFRLGVEGEVGYKGQHEKILGVMELFYILFVVVVTQLYVFA